MKKKNIQKVVMALYESSEVDFGGIDLLELIDELDEHINGSVKETVENVDPEMEEFKWENCIEGVGYWYSTVHRRIEAENNTSDITNLYDAEDIATERQIISSNLAACQLSWIIRKINNKYNSSVTTNGIQGKCLIWIDDEPTLSDYSKLSLPRLNNDEVFNVLVKTNLPLIKQYFGIE